MRAWLRVRGKKNCIGFDDEERCKLKKYFCSLDENNRGSIGCSELEEPLIALGLAENRQQVEEMVRSVDFDGSGEIEFEEFLTIVKGRRGNAAMSDFFRSLIDGTLIKNANILPFKMVISEYRRKMIKDGLMAEDAERRAQGQKVMKAFSRQNYKKVAKDIFPGDIRVGFPKLPRITEDIDYPEEEKMREIMRKFK